MANIEIDDLIDDISPELMIALPDIIKDLESNFAKKRDKVQDTLIISDIIKFAEELKEYGEMFGLRLISDYAANLFDKSKMMDIKNIDSILTEFDEIILKLKKFNQ